MSVFKYLVACSILVFVGIDAALAHPADGYPVRPLQKGYGETGYGFPSSWSYNDITFVPYPEASSLSNKEIYMIRGSTSGLWGYALPSWYFSVFQVVEAYANKHGSIPSVFSPEMFLETTDPNSIDPDYLELFKSPITGNWPILNAMDFQPGNMYIRILSEDDMHHFAELSPSFQEVWFENRMHSSNGSYESINMLTKVYYIRVYGDKGVIYNGFMYGWTSKG